MNAWQKRFAEKMDFVRAAAQDRFECFAEQVLKPVFEELRAFTKDQGLEAAIPLAKAGVRTHKFAITENAYVLITFRAKGFEQCELTAEFSVPRHDKLAVRSSCVDLLDADVTWVREQLQGALETFADAMAESFASERDLVAV